MIKSNLVNAIFLLLVFFLSCSSSDSDSDLTPSQLKVETILQGATEESPLGDGSGVLHISAKAQNASRYALRIGSNDLIESEDGTWEYQFEELGNHQYTLGIWAYSATGEFITTTVDVEVFKGERQFNKLVFADEFDYEGKPDPEKWHHQVIPPSNGSWHNDELQHYTDRLENSYVSDGTLKIKALKETYDYEGSVKQYTSARLNSIFAFTYGRIEVKAKLPAAAGAWPAIWTLGANSNEVGNYFGDQYGSAGWPLSGEIDIMEQTGWDKNSTISHFHWGDLNTEQYHDEGGEASITDAATTYHVFALEWDEKTLKTYIDDKLVYSFENAANKPFNHEHYLLLNIAIGGNLGGEVPDDFNEALFEIDYVRIYQ